MPWRPHRDSVVSPERQAAVANRQHPAAAAIAAATNGNGGAGRMSRPSSAKSEKSLLPTTAQSRPSSAMSRVSFGAESSAATATAATPFSSKAASVVRVDVRRPNSALSKTRAGSPPNSSFERSQRQTQRPSSALTRQQDSMQRLSRPSSVASRSRRRGGGGNEEDEEEETFSSSFRSPSRTAASLPPTATSIQGMYGESNLSFEVMKRRKNLWFRANRPQTEEELRLGKPLWRFKHVPPPDPVPISEDGVPLELAAALPGNASSRPQSATLRSSASRAELNRCKIAALTKEPNEASQQKRAAFRFASSPSKTKMQSNPSSSSVQNTNSSLVVALDSRIAASNAEAYSQFGNSVVSAALAGRTKSPQRKGGRDLNRSTTSGKDLTTDASFASTSSPSKMRSSSPCDLSPSRSMNKFASFCSHASGIRQQQRRHFNTSTAHNTTSNQHKSFFVSEEELQRSADRQSVEALDRWLPRKTEVQEMAANVAGKYRTSRGHGSNAATVWDYVWEPRVEQTDRVKEEMARGTLIMNALQHQNASGGGPLNLDELQLEQSGGNPTSRVTEFLKLLGA